MSEHNFTVSIAGPEAQNPGEITLVLNGVTLDPHAYDDWLRGGRYLKLADRNNFETWVAWSNLQFPCVEASRAQMTQAWDSFTEVVTGHAPVTNFTPTIGGQAGELAASPKNAIAALLDKHTNERCGWIYVEDIGALQEELNSLIPSPPIAAQVLQARGKTMIELVALGLLSDEDMANHMADCFTAITGKPCTAKHAEAFIASLRGLQTLLSGVAVQAGDAPKP